VRILASSLLVALTTLAMAQATAVTPKFELVTTDQEDMPRTKVYFVLRDRKVLTRTVTGHETKSDVVPDWAPKSTVAYTSLWWAGQGDQFYVVKKGTAYRIYHRSIDEESKPGKFRLVKSVKSAG